MVPLGIWLDWLESMWNPGGIWSEFGRNDSESRWNLGEFSLTWYSYQIPTIPTIPPGFHLDSTQIPTIPVGICSDPPGFLPFRLDPGGMSGAG